MASKSIESADLDTVDADGTFPAMFATAEISLDVLNLLSEPRLEKSNESIEADISDGFIWGFCLPSEILSIKENRLKYLLE